MAVVLENVRLDPFLGGGRVDQHPSFSLFLSYLYDILDLFHDYISIKLWPGSLGFSAPKTWKLHPSRESGGNSDSGFWLLVWFIATNHIHFLLT